MPDIYDLAIDLELNSKCHYDVTIIALKLAKKERELLKMYKSKEYYQHKLDYHTAYNNKSLDVFHQNKAFWLERIKELEKEILIINKQDWSFKNIDSFTLDIKI